MSSSIPKRLKSTRSVVFVNNRLFIINYNTQRVINIPLSAVQNIKEIEKIIPKSDFNRCFFIWRKFLKFEDYSFEKEVRSKDRKINAQKHAKKKQPSLTRRDMGLDNDVIALPLPFFCNSNILGNISTILQTSIGVLEKRWFYKDQVFVKPSPSVGSRHGIEAYVSIKNKKYYYNCENHKLECTGPSKYNHTSISLYFRPEVYMWRYEIGACLFDIYLDLGHILANISLTCSILCIDYEIRDSINHVVDLESEMPLLEIDLYL